MRVNEAVERCRKLEGLLQEWILTAENLKGYNPAGPVLDMLAKSRDAISQNDKVELPPPGSPASSKTNPGG
jgi:hypothetical protein